MENFEARFKDAMFEIRQILERGETVYPEVSTWKDGKPYFVYNGVDEDVDIALKAFRVRFGTTYSPKLAKRGMMFIMTSHEIKTREGDDEMSFVVDVDEV